MLEWWWKGGRLEADLEGMLSVIGGNRFDLEEVFPSPWWPGCRSRSSSKAGMKKATEEMGDAVDKVSQTITPGI